MPQAAPTAPAALGATAVGLAAGRPPRRIIPTAAAAAEREAAEQAAVLGIFRGGRREFPWSKPSKRCSTCHKCAGPAKDGDPTATVCQECNATYHKRDCGKRFARADLSCLPPQYVGQPLADLVELCPRCSGLCQCSGGVVRCNNSRMQQRRSIAKDRPRYRPKQPTAFLEDQREPMQQQAHMALSAPTRAHTAPSPPSRVHMVPSAPSRAQRPAKRPPAARSQPRGRSSPYMSDASATAAQAAGAAAAALAARNSHNANGYGFFGGLSNLSSSRNASPSLSPFNSGDLLIPNPAINSGSNPTALAAAAVAAASMAAASARAAAAAQAQQEQDQIALLAAARAMLNAQNIASSVRSAGSAGADGLATDPTSVDDAAGAVAALASLGSDEMNVEINRHLKARGGAASSTESMGILCGDRSSRAERSEPAKRSRNTVRNKRHKRV